MTQHLTDWKRDFIIGASIVTLLTAVGIVYGEVTDSRAAVRPFLLTAVLLSAWRAGWPGALVATATAVMVVSLYSTRHGVGSMESDEITFLIAFTGAVVLISLFATQRKRTEQELRQATEALEEASRKQADLLRVAELNRERYELLANVMPQLVWSATPDGVVDYYNARVEDYGGVERRDDGTWRWQPLLHPDDVAATTNAWTAASAAVTPYEAEHRMLMKDGTYRWHVSRAVPVTQADGSVHWYGTATDIEDLQQALNAKDEFLALVSHDLRSPLTTILGSASLLRRGLFETDEDRTEAAAEIESKARQLAQTIDELVELARLQGLPHPRLEPILIEHTANDVISEFQHNQPCEIRLECSNPSIRAEGHEPYLRRILQNLLSNAWKYGQDTPIEVQIEPDGDRVTVRVMDRGIGLDEETAAHVFDPFYRGANVAGIKTGLGIGLTLCQRLVEAQGGQIGAAPRPGGGSTFWFTLRCPSETAAATESNA